MNFHIIATTRWLQWGVKTEKSDHAVVAIKRGKGEEREDCREF